MDNDEPQLSQTSPESNPEISESDRNSDKSRPLVWSCSMDHLAVSSEFTVFKFEKHVPKEVNHSVALCKTLYEKEDIISRLIMHLCQIKVVHLQEKEVLQKQIQDLQEASHLELEGQRAKITELNQLLKERELAYQEEHAKLQEQMHSVNEAIAKLERLMQAHEQVNRQEREMLQEQMHATNKAAALQHKADINKLQKQFETEMKDQLEKIVAMSRLNLSKALEQRDQELNEKLQMLQENMRIAQGNNLTLNPA
ncbi:hypothetical protein L210DRAFT_3640042 [Boletus edulis BED1]|uniref:Uncharacterized protein n=1 Tax=Boletus edulis BED1 TaxID=1328754 RepID=A0AAD4GMH8_BOLED|nr:hypothetical protein L210DRAFT_3640042 [Boletus edulis BED1]